MKEIPKGYTNPFLSDEENEKLNLWNQDLERSNIENEKETELYTDKSVTQCDLPDFLICYKEGAFHVKDICIDEGICHGERFLFDENNNEMLKMEDYYREPNLCSEMNGKFDTGLPVLEASNDHMNIGDNHDEVDADLPVSEPINDYGNMGNISTDTQIPVQDIQNLVPNELKEMPKDDINNGDDGLCECSPDRSMFSSESDTILKAVDDNGLDIVLQPGEAQISTTDDSYVQQDQPFPSLKSLLESIEQQPCQGPVEETSKVPVDTETKMESNATLDLTNIEPPSNSELSIDPHSALKLHDVDSDNVPVVNPVHHNSEGESSFSVIGPISGLITNSGPIGSTSIRSDSSTTSTRSFAFPILQNEWNSSPVRMAKAEGRRLQKHRGWRLGVLCCRF